MKVGSLVKHFDGTYGLVLDIKLDYGLVLWLGDDEPEPYSFREISSWWYIAEHYKKNENR